ncbi:MAG: hypothetical protein GEU78_07275 [Actinobacteria bacterium]|nr:hypothetical protein [Actinomycetota bacterium]
MAFRALAPALVLALALAACDPSDRPPPAARPTSPAAVSPTPEQRTPSVRLPKIDNRASGVTRARLQRAIRDLRAVGFWRRLTKNLYVVSIGSRPGRQYVPEDGHLAEARAFPFLDDDGAGRLCDITFFPTAINDDLRLQAHYHEEGLLDRAPPTRRHFWAAILGHELAHCLPNQKDGLPALTGEAVARRWEKRVLAAVERLQPALES